MLALVATTPLVGLFVLVNAAWYVSSPLLVTAAWLFAVERSVGVARFVRIDPWPPRSKRGRRQRAVLISVVLVASLAVSVLIGLKHPDPPAVATGCYALLGVYSWWAIAFMNSHGAERIVRAKAPE